MEVGRSERFKDDHRSGQIGASVLWYALPVAFLIVTGCSDSVADMTCSDVAKEAIRISEGTLVAVNGQTQTSKNDQRIICHGIGFTNSGNETPARFQAFKDDNGDILVKYDTDEYQAAEAVKEAGLEQKEQAQTDHQIQQTIDQAMSEGQAEAASMTAQ